MQRSTLYKGTHLFAWRESGAGEAKLPVDQVIDLCVNWTLLAIVGIGYLTSGDVRHRFPHIIRWIVHLPLYTIYLLAVMGVLVVAGTIDTVGNDVIDAKIGLYTSVDVFVVISLMLRVCFSGFCRKDHHRAVL